MTAVCADTPGYLYVLCFDRPIGNAANTRAQARHYLGWALDVPARVAMHAAGHGAALTQAVVAAQIGWQVFYRPGTPSLERWLKAHYKQTPGLCPRCCVHRGRRAAYGFQPLDQLAFPLEVAADVDFPALPPGRADWMEIQLQRSWRATAMTFGAPPDLARLDDLL